MKKIKWLAAGIVCLSACMGSQQKAAVGLAETGDTLYLCVGRYASAADEGVQMYQFNQETGEAVYVSGLKGVSNPSYLVASTDGNRIYVVGEDEGASSTVNAVSFDRQTGKLVLMNTQLTQGELRVM